ncbi:hypothetical protein HDV00_009925 [Rhizophlyctis rosea]|nr:hypothetical protein HDV00_009925 [Rhizophlyctis rosea]
MALPVAARRGTLYAVIVFLLLSIFIQSSYAAQTPLKSFSQLQSESSQPQCDAASCARRQKLTPAMMQYLAGQAVDKHRAKEQAKSGDQKKSTEEGLRDILKTFDTNKNNRLDKDELFAMIKTFEGTKVGDDDWKTRAKNGGSLAQPAKEDDDWNEELRFQNVMDALGLGSFNQQELLEIAGDSNDELFNHDSLISLASENDTPSNPDNDRIYGSTIKMIESKIETLHSLPPTESTQSCAIQLRIAIRIAKRNAEMLPTFECLTLKPAALLCECFAPGGGWSTPLHRRSSDSDAAIYSDDYSSAAQTPAIGLHRRLTSFDGITDMTSLLHGDRISTSNVGIREFKSAVRYLTRPVLFAVSKLFDIAASAATDAANVGGRVAAQISARVIGLLAAEIAVEVATLVVGAVIGIVSIFLAIFLSLNFFSCDIVENDFKYPLQEVSDAGDFVPMDLIAWNPDTDAKPKCALAVYKSRDCVSWGTQSCSDGGKYRAPTKGMVNGRSDKDVVEASGMTLADCAKICYDSGVCSAFSATLGDDSFAPGKVICRMAITDQVDVIDADQSTTWFAKAGTSAFSTGVQFADIVANFKILWMSGTPGSGEKWTIATTVMTLSLLMMGNCLERVAHAFPNLVAHMNTKYTTTKDFDSALTQLTKFLSAGFQDNMEAIKGCAYLDNPDGLEATAAANIYFASRSINLFHVANDILEAARSDGVNPGDGYENGVPTSGIDPSFRVLVQRPVTHYSDMPSHPIDTDTDLEMPDADDEEPPQTDPTRQEVEKQSMDNYINLTKMLGSVAAAIATVNRVTTNTDNKEDYEWVRLHVANVGQADNMYLEFNQWTCKKISVAGVGIKWRPSLVMFYSGWCDINQRRRTWVDGGVQHGMDETMGLIKLAPFLGWAYQNGVQQSYVFDEVVVTHLDIDHYILVSWVLQLPLILQGAIYAQWIRTGANLRWNNYVDSTWRNGIGLPAFNGGEPTQNPYTAAYNWLMSSGTSVETIVKILSPPRGNWDKAGTDTWAQVLSKNGVTAPTGQWWTGLRARVNPQRVTGNAYNTDAGWDQSGYDSTGQKFNGDRISGEHITFARRAAQLTSVSAFQGHGTAIASYGGISAATSILWPQQISLSTMAQRCSFGGLYPVGTTQWGSYVKRDWADEDECESVNGTVTCNIVNHPSHLYRRASDTGYNPQKNHLSIVTKTTVNNARIVLTGDAVSRSMSLMAQNNAGHLNTDLLKIPHHGSSTTGDRSNLNGLQADVVVITGRYESKGVVGTNKEPSPPYSAKYLIWIIQEHYRQRPGNKLTIYVTDWPADWALTTLRALRDKVGVRPNDCNYVIRQTWGGYFGFFSFNTRTNQSPDDPAISETVIGSWPVNLGRLPAQGSCDLSWDSTSDGSY